MLTAKGHVSNDNPAKRSEKTYILQAGFIALNQLKPLERF